MVVEDIKAKAIARLKKSQKLNVAFLIFAIFLLVVIFVIFAVFADENGEISTWLNAPVALGSIVSLFCIFLLPFRLKTNTRALKFVTECEVKSVAVQTAIIDAWAWPAVYRPPKPRGFMFEQVEIKQNSEKLEGIFTAYKHRSAWPFFAGTDIDISNSDETFLFSQKGFTPISEGHTSLDDSLEKKLFYIFSPKLNMILEFRDFPRFYKVEKYGLLVKYKAKS